MLFSISAFALFILMSYYASNTNIQTQLHGGHSHSAHALVAPIDGNTNNTNSRLKQQEFLGNIIIKTTN